MYHVSLLRIVIKITTLYIVIYIYIYITCQYVVYNIFLFHLFNIYDIIDSILILKYINRNVIRNN